MVQAGDKCDFIGSLIAVPDVSQLRTEGARAETSTRVRAGEGYDSEGVRGLKALGVRDLTYRLAFLACAVQQTQPGVSDCITVCMCLRIISVWWSGIEWRGANCREHS